MHLQSHVVLLPAGHPLGPGPLHPNCPWALGWQCDTISMGNAFTWGFWMHPFTTLVMGRGVLLALGPSVSVGIFRSRISPEGCVWNGRVNKNTSKKKEGTVCLLDQLFLDKPNENEYQNVKSSSLLMVWPIFSHPFSRLCWPTPSFPFIPTSNHGGEERMHFVQEARPARCGEPRHKCHHASVSQAIDTTHPRVHQPGNI